MVNLDKVKEVANLLGSGFVRTMLPNITAGAMQQLFTDLEATPDKIVDYVENDRSLWDKLDEEQWQTLKVAAQKMGNLDFVTAKFVVDAIKPEHIRVASLFLGWPEAMQWLEKQVDTLQERLYSE